MINNNDPARLVCVRVSPHMLGYFIKSTGKERLSYTVDGIPQGSRQVGVTYSAWPPDVLFGGRGEGPKQILDSFWRRICLDRYASTYSNSIPGIDGLQKGD